MACPCCGRASCPGPPACQLYQSVFSGVASSVGGDELYAYLLAEYGQSVPDTAVSALTEKCIVECQQSAGSVAAWAAMQDRVQYDRASQQWRNLKVQLLSFLYAQFLGLGQAAALQFAMADADTFITVHKALVHRRQAGATGAAQPLFKHPSPQPQWPQSPPQGQQPQALEFLDEDLVGYTLDWQPEPAMAPRMSQPALLTAQPALLTVQPALLTAQSAPAASQSALPDAPQMGDAATEKAVWDVFFGQCNKVLLRDHLMQLLDVCCPGTSPQGTKAQMQERLAKVYRYRVYDLLLALVSNNGIKKSVLEDCHEKVTGSRGSKLNRQELAGLIYLRCKKAAQMQPHA